MLRRLVLLPPGRPVDLANLLDGQAVRLEPVQEQHQVEAGPAWTGYEQAVKLKKMRGCADLAGA
jgi:hypothetical protein